MFSENNKDYIHIYIDLADEAIYFHSVSAPFPLGKALLDFIYADLEAVEARPEKLKDIHPYFLLWTEGMIKEFVHGGGEEKESGFTYLRKLQDVYKNLLEAVRSKPSETTEEILHYLSCHSFYSSATLVSRTVKNENQWMMDYFLKGFEDCLMCELMEMTRRHVTAKICKNCGRFFVPKRSNVDYCSRIFSEDGKTCSDVGYMKTFAKTVKKDELLQAYTRAYKAHYARMTKPRKKAANMTREEFEAWYKQAKDGLEMARQGKIDQEAYKEWLKK